MSAGEVRLFFALWPDDAMRARLAAAAIAPGALPGVRAVNPEKYHLTIAFVGAVAAGELDRVRRIGAAQRAAPFTIAFDAYEYWPKPEVVVAAARNLPAALAALWQALHQGLADGGFALRPKRLRPHVTLAKKVAQEPVLPALARFTWSAGEFCLARSDSRGADTVYTVLDTWPLLDGGANN